MDTNLAALKEDVGRTVRRLRKDRRWTLAELGRRLHVSESRLSEIERGKGSFTAEQLLVVFQLFHVGPSDFIRPDATRDPIRGSLQNALIQFGERSLLPIDGIVVRPEHSRPIEAVREVLVGHPTSRFLIAVPPVLVYSLADIPLSAVQAQVANAGVAFRWGWLLDHFLAALEVVGSAEGSKIWRTDSHRARTVAEHFLDHLPRPTPGTTPDLLDPDLRSRQSVANAEASASAIDRRWHVVSRLSTADFVPPLEFLRDTL